VPKVKRAIISVYDKTGIVEFARSLRDLDIEIISTGGTARHLNEHGISTTAIESITEFPEILQGRVKTLHPKIFGGLLSLRDDTGHMQEIAQHGISRIDLVVVNLYPFEATIAKPDATLKDAMENIDIGGPSMIRAAAKNFTDVAVMTSPAQYQQVVTCLQDGNGELSLELRQQLARQAFALTARYDTAIQKYFLTLEKSDVVFPDQLWMSFDKVQELRYGENPHQRAALYRPTGGAKSGLMTAEQLHGKALSYNNIIDLDGTVRLVQSFPETCVAIVKHTNPCGVAVAENLADAYVKAKATDPVSAFGGIVGCNRTVDEETAAAISEIFTEVLVAPAFSEAALALLRAKKNLRIMRMPEIANPPASGIEFRSVQGAMLQQDQDFYDLSDIEFKVVSERQPEDAEWAAMKFGWRVVQWVKSNAVVYSRRDRSIGIGAGQMSRVDASRIAVEKARKMGLDLAGTAVASDAFFPFRDGIDEAARAGATCVIQPGGSIRDEEVIAAADEHGMVMVFTGIRHFRH